MSRLIDALKTLHTLTYDELTDLIDLLRDQHDDRPPARHGKPPLNAIIPGGWRPDPDGNPDRTTPPARVELRTAWGIAADLDDDDAHALIEQAALVRDALAPRTQRQRDDDGQPVARGTLQTKKINRTVKETDAAGNIHFVRRAFGPYLYLRIWATGGGKNRDQRRLKNIYLGCKTLAHDLDTLDGDDRAALVEDILTAYENGGVDAVRALDTGARPPAVDKLGSSDMLPNYGTDQHTDAQRSLGSAGVLPKKRSADAARPFRPTPAQLKLLKRAASATDDAPRYVTRDTGNYAALVELQRAGLVEVFTRGNSTKRRYYQLTAAGRAAAKRRFDQL